MDGKPELSKFLEVLLSLNETKLDNVTRPVLNLIKDC